MTAAARPRLSVVIPCRDDRRLPVSVASIDEDVEVVVVLNGSPPGFRAAIESAIGQRARIEELPRAHMPGALEHGIRAASCDRVVLMDSDCTFEPGALGAMAAAFERGDPDGEVYKGTIVFDSGASRAGALVARSRAQRWSGSASLHKPPLALDRRLAARLGGWFFDRRQIWKVDAAFGQRLTEAGIRVVLVRDCVVHHAPMSLGGDLRSSFRYGLGAAIAAARGLVLPRTERSVATALRRHGLPAALYMAVSNRVRAAGYAYAAARIRLTRGRWLCELAGE